MTLEYSIKRKESLKYSATLMKCPKLLNQIYAIGYKIAAANLPQHLSILFLYQDINFNVIVIIFYSTYKNLFE